MGEESSADNGGGTKPDANQSSQDRQGGRNGKRNKKKNNNNNRFTSAKGDTTFKGASDKIGVFAVQNNRAEATTQYNDTLASIVTYAADEHGPRVSKSIEKGKLILPAPPTDATDDEARKEHRKEVNKINNSLMTIYQLVYNNCDPTYQDALKDADDFENMDDTMDILKLLKRIKSLTFTGTTTTDPILATLMLLKEVFNTRQNKLSIPKFDEKLTSVLKAADELFGGPDKFLAIFDPLLASVIAAENGESVTGADAITADVKEEYAKQGRERMKGMLFCLGVDRGQYGGVIEQMNQDYLKGNAAFPHSQRLACTLFRSVKVKTSQPRYQDRDDDGHHFNINGDESGESSGDGGGGNKNPNIKCFRCGRTGHIAAKCGEAKHADGHVLHTMGEVVEESSPPAEDGIADDDVDGEVEHEF